MKYIVLITCLSIIHLCAGDNSDVLRQIEALEKKLLPSKDTSVQQLKPFFGEPANISIVGFHTDGKVIRMERHSFELIRNYWLYVNIHEGKVHSAHYGFNDPRKTWATAGQDEYSTPEHAVKRLNVLNALVEKLKKAKENSNKPGLEQSASPPSSL